MEFKKGDKVTFVNNREGYIPDNYYSEGIDSDLIQHGSTQWDGKDGEVVGILNGYVVVRYTYNEQVMQLGFSPKNLKLLNSKSLHKTMEKKIYNVLVVNKKTGKVDRHEIVSAENEQSAILKAFGVDVENVFIKIKEEGSYTEDKPVTAVLVKENKETKTPKAEQNK